MSSLCLSKMKKAPRIPGGQSASSKASKSTQISMNRMRPADPQKRIQSRATESSYQRRKTWPSWRMICSVPTPTRGETLRKPCSSRRRACHVAITTVIHRSSLSATTRSSTRGRANTSTSSKRSSTRSSISSKRRKKPWKTTRATSMTATYTCNNR